ncbi:MAG: YggS family pyridoxal phosphate-dependent enzyme [Candidatus Omnitrophica bacterium]|nr:YggS family pyridoxal phosphate-dependent enzyme [Candidatus Omnitrophota bacterium]
MLQAQLQQVRERISHACQRCGRDPSSVTLIGVTKTVSADVVGEAIQLGLTDLGENRVQEAQAKRQALGFKLQASDSSVQPVACSLQPVRWHLIGHLQRNKVKLAIELFDVIHSVDSLELVNELDRQAAQRGTRVDILVQVNVSGEATKFGCAPQEVAPLAHAINRMAHLRFIGLMTMAPFSDHAEAARPYFRRLRTLRDDVVSSFQLPASSLCLSMGMSGDFEVAIEEGADFVRIGTAIFGGRGQGARDAGQET